MVNVVDYLLGKAGLAMRTQEVSEAEALLASGFDPPRSIREMIERNLERLKPEEQVVLEGASVAGPEFSAASVAAALERPQDEIEACCARLSRHEQFVSTQGSIIWPDGTIAAGFRFQHTLYQEVLYGRVPVGHQVRLHRRIAVREELGYGDHAVEVASELAYHYSRANDKNKAIEYFRLAGERAVARGAFTEAETAYRQALTMLRQSESPERDVLELALMSPFARVLQLKRGWASPEAAEVVAHTRTLAEKTGNLPQLVMQVMGTWAVAVTSGDLALAIAVADELLDLAEREGSPASLGAAHTAQVISRYFVRGDLNGAEEHFIHGGPFFESAWKVFPGLASNLFGAASHVAWLRGHADIAQDRSRKSISIARELNNPFEVACAQFWAAGLHVFIGDYKQARTLAAQSVALSHEQGFSQTASTARIVLGRAEAGLGRPDTGLPQIRQGLTDMVKAGAGVSRTQYLTWLTEALALDGDTSSAVATIEEALQANSEELTWRVYALTARGELLLKLGQTGAAQSTCRDAIAQAKKIGAKTLELRATICLARLLTEHTKRNEALTMLTEIYSWFTEGFDTPDLKDAKALLDELNA
jgi:tetratricopeptide (TPR) repeat protein